MNFKYEINEEEESFDLESIKNFDELIKKNDEYLNKINCYSKKSKMLSSKSHLFEGSLSSRSSIYDLLDEANEFEDLTKSNLEYKQAIIIDDSLIEENQQDQSLSDSKKDSKYSSKKEVSQSDDQIILVDSGEENDIIIEKEENLTKPTKRKHEYEAVDFNNVMETEIDNIWNFSELNSQHIRYMVLRDVNYFLDIFSGTCEHSWRHKEYKKFSKKSANYFYENSALSCFTQEQYTEAVYALQFIFCKKNHKYNDYIIKVLLPEALIKICMRIYQCSKMSAEEFLLNNNLKTMLEAYPLNSMKFKIPRNVNDNVENKSKLSKKESRPKCK